MEDPAVPGRKAQWFYNALDAVKNRMTAVKAWVYYHAHSPAGYDFWIDTSQSSLDAFKAIGQDPHFNPPPA